LQIKGGLPVKNRRRIVLVSLIIVIALALPVGWYLISPLFIDRSVEEAFPTSSSSDEIGEPNEDSMSEEFRATATTAMGDALTEPDTIMEERMPADMARMMILAQGAFYDIAHHGMGTATIYQLEDGSQVLRFEDFEVLNGPELHVYLAPIDPVPDTIGVELEGAIDLGLLKGNIGNQNYELPPDLDISQHKSVVIWCQPFRVPFNAASLNSP
jgi:hypothetical protein